MPDPGPKMRSSDARHREHGWPGGPASNRRSREPKRRRFPAVAAALSVLAHVVLVASFLNAPLWRSDRVHSTDPDHGVVSMRLLSRVEDRTDVVDDSAVTTFPEDAVERPLHEDTFAGPARPEPVGPDTVDDTRSASLDGPASVAEQEQAGALRATLLDQVRSLPSEAGRDGTRRLPWASSGDPLPGLPGARGWLSAYVGTVTPSAHTWTDTDGSNRGHYVMADGTMICTRRRAPTSDELMNPWKSTAVTMVSGCGRQRPEAPDFSDPRVRPPPAIRGDLAGDRDGDHAWDH